MCNLLLIWLILALLSILCTSRGPQYLDVPYRARVQQVLTDLCGAKAEEANALLQIGAVSYRYRCKSKIIWQKAEQDQLLDESMQVRYYNPPTRYPACYQDDWEARLLKLHDDYIVINKPHGLPCMAHPSNSEEHLTPCVKR